MRYYGTQAKYLAARHPLLPHSTYLQGVWPQLAAPLLFGSLLQVLCAGAQIAMCGLQVMCKPGTVTPHKKFEAEIYALNKEEGGRHKPFFSNYKPQFYFRTADITGACRLP